MREPRLSDEQKRLVEQYLPELPRLLGSKFFRPLINRLGYDDAYQVGAVALMHAAKLYDAAKGEFLPYADWWIRHHLTREVAKSGLVRDRNNRVGGRPGPMRVTYLGDTVSDTVFDGTEGQFELSEVRDEILGKISILGHDEKAVIRLMAGGLTAQEVGRRFGLSRESVRLILETAVLKLRYGQGGSQT